MLSAVWIRHHTGHYPCIRLIENERLVIGMVDDASSIENHPQTIAINAQDPENDAVTWSATGLPTGASLNTASGMITGAPTTAGRHKKMRGAEAPRSMKSWLICLNLPEQTAVKCRKPCR